MVLMMEGQSSIIADLNDLREVLSITQNFDGLPKFKAEFFNDIFYRVFKKRQNQIQILTKFKDRGREL